MRNTLNMNWKKMMMFVIVACFAYSTGAQTALQTGKCMNPLQSFFDNKNLRETTCASNSPGDSCQIYCKEGYTVKGTVLNYVEFTCSKISRTQGKLQWRGPKCFKSQAQGSGDSPSTTPASSTSTITCPREPTGLEKLNIESATCENMTPGTRCELHCKAGFINGNSITKTIQCQADGKWLIPATEPCSKILCPAIPALELNTRNLTTCSTKRMYINDTCDLDCKQGYEKSGWSVGSTVACRLISNKKSGKWFGYQGKQCIKRRCEAPRFSDRHVDTTDCTTAKTLVDAECTVQCRRGYIFAGESRQKIIHCLRTSPGIEPSWSPALTRIGGCQKLTCSPLEFNSAINQPEIVGHCGNSQQSNCNLRCQNGYEFFNGNTEKTVICSLKKDDEEPSWPADIGTCQKKSCEAPQFPDGLVDTADCDRAKTFVNSKCTVQCPRGYRFEGESRQRTIKCVRISLGTEPSWSPALTRIGSCQKLSCRPLEFSSGIHQPRIIGNCGTSQEANCSLSCQIGYEFYDRNRRKTVECSLRSGEEEPSWPANIGTCRRMTCDEPNFGGKHIDSTSCSNTRYGSSCDVQCNAGYKFPNRKTRVVLQCDWSVRKTVWSPPPSTISACQEITCPDITRTFTTPPPGSFLPGVLNVAKCTSGRTTYGSECTLKCQEGYAFENKENEKTFTCDEVTENWNVPEGGVGFCSDTTCDAVEEVSDGLFLKSLLPEIRRMTDKQKLLFKMRMIKLIADTAYNQQDDDALEF